jgi:hypothetical protein
MSDKRRVSRIIVPAMAGLMITLLATVTTAAHDAQPITASLEVLAAGLIGTFAAIGIYWQVSR